MATIVKGRYGDFDLAMDNDFASTDQLTAILERIGAPRIITGEDTAKSSIGDESATA